MPISREKMKLYPGGSIRSKAWLAIRKRILKRAKDRCEGSPAHPKCRARNGWEHPETGSIVVLTIAHLDHNIENNKGRNLRALCQRCHLGHDAKHHRANAARRRAGPHYPMPGVE